MPDAVTERRDLIIERLSADYARGAFEVEELERRLALAHAASSTAELDALSPEAAPAMALIPAQQLRVIFGSIERVGPWTVPPQLTARVTCGNLVLDLRDARIAPGMTTLEVSVTMGNVEVIVPPGVEVDVEASSLLGHIEERTERAPARAASTIRVIGRVKLGHLELSTMRLGETRRDARRRRRAGRRWRRRMHRHALPWE